MILRVPETDHGPGEKLAHETRRGTRADQPLPFEGNDLSGHHRLGRAVMNVADLEAEHVARQMKGADLAAAIGEQLRDAHHARDDLVNVASNLAFGEDLAIPGKAHKCYGRDEGLGCLSACRERCGNRGTSRFGCGDLYQHRDSPEIRNARCPWYARRRGAEIRGGRLRRTT